MPGARESAAQGRQYFWRGVPMTREVRSTRRTKVRDQFLSELPTASAVSWQALDEGQRWVLFAFLQVLKLLAPVPMLRRVAAYCLCHCGMDLRLQLIAQVLD